MIYVHVYSLCLQVKQSMSFFSLHWEADTFALPTGQLTRTLGMSLGTVACAVRGHDMRGDDRRLRQRHGLKTWGGGGLRFSKAGWALHKVQTHDINFQKNIKRNHLFPFLKIFRGHTP